MMRKRKKKVTYSGIKYYHHPFLSYRKGWRLAIDPEKGIVSLLREKDVYQHATLNEAGMRVFLMLLAFEFCSRDQLMASLLAGKQDLLQLNERIPEDLMQAMRLAQKRIKKLETTAERDAYLAPLRRAIKQLLKELPGLLMDVQSHRNVGYSLRELKEEEEE